MDDLTHRFEKLGFPKKEAQVYLALLEIGNGTVHEIATKANLKRSTTYILLDVLAEKGLVSIASDKTTKVYTATHPERLIQVLEEQVKERQEVVKLGQDMLPYLNTLYPGSGPKPKVLFFEGLKGVQSVYEDTLTSSETIRAYASIENMHAALPDYFPEYYRRRAGNGISIRSIHPDTPESEERVTHDKQEARDSALVPTDKYAFSPEINIYDNKIAFMSLRERFGLIIESEELATAMKKVFELSWKEAKRLNNKLRKK